MTSDTGVAGKIFTIANALTYARLVLMPFVMVGIVTHNAWLAVGAMFLAWFTDLLDGTFARRAGPPTLFGKALDSTVDFALIYCLFIAFYAAGRLEHYQFGFLYLSMLTILTLQLFLQGTGHGEETATTRLGKLNGGLQYAYLLFLVALEVLPASDIISMVHFVYFAVVAFVIVLNSVECIQVMRKLVRTAESA